MAKESTVIGALHMTKECPDCGKKARIKLRSAISGGEESKWMVQALAVCAECDRRLSQSLWVEIPGIDTEVEIFREEVDNGQALDRS